jgi:hypothetical protein
VVLLLVPSPLRGAAPGVLGSLLVAAVLVAVVVMGVVLLGRAMPGLSPAAIRRVGRAVREDVRHGLLGRPAWPGVGLASTVAVTGHVATYLLAAHAVGVDATPVQLAPLALVVLLAMAIPLNVAGWGPREGVAAWIFGLAGLGAAQGVATAVAYGVLATVANLPGVVVVTGVLRHG